MLIVLLALYIGLGACLSISYATEKYDECDLNIDNQVYNESDFIAIVGKDNISDIINNASKSIYVNDDLILNFTRYFYEV